MSSSGGCCGASRSVGAPVGLGALRVDVERPRGPAAPFKAVVMGDKGIGKSSIVVRFTKGAYADGGMTATIGAAFAMKDVRVDDASLARLQIWDTAGEEIYRAMTRNFFREAAVGLVVYDVTSQASFASVPQWLADFADACPDALTVLVANKADVPDEARRVSTADGAAFAAARGLPFFEVSAKTGARVEEMFAHVAQALVTARRSRLLL